MQFSNQYEYWGLLSWILNTFFMIFKKMLFRDNLLWRFLKLTSS